MAIMLYLKEINLSENKKWMATDKKYAEDSNIIAYGKTEEEARECYYAELEEEL